jgi:hypothetical protein
MTLSAGSLYSVELQDDRAMINLKGYVRRTSWSNPDPIPEIALRGEVCTSVHAWNALRYHMHQLL